MGLNYEKKWCKKCGFKLQKWGENRDGSQRYFCKECKQTKTRKRPEITEVNHKKLFVKWLLGKLSLSEISLKYGVKRQTLNRWFQPFWNEEPTPKEVNISGKVLIIDGKYVARDGCVLISTCDKKPSHWHFTQRENHSSWLTFFNKIKHIPFAFVCDGQKGMIKAIKQRFPGIIIQRCQFHVIKYIRSKLTKNPENITAIELKELVLKITKIKTKKQLKKWLKNYKVWWKTHKDFIKEKTISETEKTPTGRKRWHYTHQNLHASHSHLKNSIPNIFMCIRYPEIPSTTNFVEGAINSQMQEKLRSL